MFTHPEVLFDLARQHQNELIDEARTVSLARTARRGRAAGRRARRAAGRTQSHDDGSHPDWAGLDQARPATVTATSGARTTGPDAADGIGAVEWSAPAGSLVACGVVGAGPAQ